MAAWNFPLKNLHPHTVVVTILMLVMRFNRLQAGSAMLSRRWIRSIGHLHDALLRVFAVLLAPVAHLYPLGAQANGLTEKPFGVIIYLAPDFIALASLPCAAKMRWPACAVPAITRLAITKMPPPGVV